MKNRKKAKILALFLSLSWCLSGCSSQQPTKASDGQKWQEDWIQVGTTMGIETPKQLTLLDNKEALAADGLYYATWTAGSFVPYENSDGDTIDLYDAQLYLLVSEAKNEKSAEKSCQTWLAAAKDNYEVLETESITCNGQPYTMLSYNCISEDSPYDHGVSALGVYGTDAICAELTCVDGYDEDLTQMLMEFLDKCHYSAK